MMFPLVQVVFVTVPNVAVFIRKSGLIPCCTAIHALRRLKEIETLKQWVLNQTV
jgi:hypothetical protein